MKSPCLRDWLLEERVSPGSSTTLSHHLTNDHLEVLVVDLHTLETVHFLDLIDEVLLNRSRTLDGQDVCWSDGSVRQWAILP